MAFKKRPITRLRSLNVCPWCGLKYERFRSAYVPSWQDAQIRVLAAAKEFADNGDYDKPCRRNGILGLMHQLKLAAWKDEHLYWCQREHEPELAAPVCTNPEPIAEPCAVAAVDPDILSDEVPF